MSGPLLLTGPRFRLWSVSKRLLDDDDCSDSSERKRALTDQNFCFYCSVEEHIYLWMDKSWLRTSGLPRSAWRCFEFLFFTLRCRNHNLKQISSEEPLSFIYLFFLHSSLFGFCTETRGSKVLSLYFFLVLLSVFTPECLPRRVCVYIQSRSGSFIKPSLCFLNWQVCSSRRFCRAPPRVRTCVWINWQKDFCLTTYRIWRTPNEPSRSWREFLVLQDVSRLRVVFRLWEKPVDLWRVLDRVQLLCLLWGSCVGWGSLWHRYGHCSFVLSHSDRTSWSC